MSAGRQIRQASKQAIKKNKQCGSNPPNGVPLAESHKSVDSASQGGYSWLIANWEQRYATKSRDVEVFAQHRMAPFGGPENLNKPSTIAI